MQQQLERVLFKLETNSLATSPFLMCCSAFFKQHSTHTELQQYNKELLTRLWIHAHIHWKYKLNTENMKDKGAIFHTRACVGVLISLQYATETTVCDIVTVTPKSRLLSPTALPLPLGYGRMLSWTAWLVHSKKVSTRMPRNRLILSVMPIWSSSKKCSQYSITECRVPELIAVLGSQPAGEVSGKPGGRLPLLSARPTVTLTTLKRAAANFTNWWTEARWVWTVCLRLLPGSVVAAIWTQAFCAGVQHANHLATEPPFSMDCNTSDSVTVTVTRVPNSHHLRDEQDHCRVTVDALAQQLFYFYHRVQLPTISITAQNYCLSDIFQNKTWYTSKTSLVILNLYVKWKATAKFSLSSL